MTVRVQTEDFDLSTEIAALRAENPKIGAVVAFVGTVRDLSEGEHVEAMELEHYPGMTEKALEGIEQEAKRRWPGRRRVRVAGGPDRAPGGQTFPARPDRVGGCHVGAPAKRIRRLLVRDGLLKDAGAVLEEGDDAAGCALG